MARLLIYFYLLFTISSCSFLNHEKSEKQTQKAKLHLKLGTAHYSNQKYHRALKEFMTANELDPDNPLILTNLGIAYFALDRLPIGEKMIRRALEIEPSYTDARVNLAKVQIEMGLVELAIKNLKICEEDLTYSDTDNIHYHYGLALFKLKDFVGAEEKFKLTLEKHPKHCFAMLYYGRSLFERKLYRTASESLDEAIGLCEGQRLDDAHFYSALSHYKINNIHTSSARLKELLELYPNTAYATDAKKILRLLK